MESVLAGPEQYNLSCGRLSSDQPHALFPSRLHRIHLKPRPHQLSNKEH